MAISEDLIERLTQDDVFYYSDLGSLVDYHSDGEVKNSSERFLSLKLCVLESIWKSLEKNKCIDNEESSDNYVDNTPEREKQELSSNSNLLHKLPLLLLIPLIDSQIKSDPTLIESTASILFKFLEESPCLASSEYSDQLDSIEDLLLRWSGSSSNVSIASVLVALACTRRSLRTIVRTINLLQQSKGKDLKLKVGHILSSLSPYGYDPLPPIPSYISEGWSVKNYGDLSYNYDDQEDEFRRRRMAVSPAYIYLLSGNEGIVKIGNGREGTVRGRIYATNPGLNRGFLAYTEGHLVLHSANEKFEIIDENTLTVIKELKNDAQLQCESSETLHFLSDGAQFFWIRSLPSSPNEDELQIILDIFDIQNHEAIRSQNERVYLRRNAVVADKKIDSERNNLITSTGLDIKTLFQAPVLTCGHYVTILIQSQKCMVGGRPPGGLFAHSFNVQNGQLSSKTDFTDAFLSKRQYQRRLQLNSSAASYDTFNDLIWIAFSGGIIGLESYNFKSLMYAKKLLRIPKSAQLLSQEEIYVDDVRKELLRRGALLCFFQKVHPNLKTESKTLFNLLQESLTDEDIEGSFCLLKIISKTEMDVPFQSMLNQFNGDSHLNDFVLDVILETLKDDDEKLFELIGLMKETSNSALKNKLLKFLSTFQTMTSNRLLKMMQDEEDLIEDLILECITESKDILVSTNVQCIHPNSSILLQFLINLLSRYANFIILEAKGFDEEHFIQFCLKIIRPITDKFLQYIIESKVYKKSNYEQTIKSTPLGTLVHTLITVLLHPKFQTVNIIRTLSIDMVHLWHSVSEIACIQWKKTTDGNYLGTETGFLSTIPELDAWEPYRIFESQHPIKKPYKYEESLNIQNVPVIYLQFDPRCAIEPEDKLTIYRWNRVLIEFTQDSWPSTPYRIDWPTSINIKFESKGNKKVWGFRVLASEHLSQLQFQNLKIPHMAEMSLVVLSLLRSYMNILFTGPLPNAHEDKSKPLLELKLLDRCIWDREKFQDISRIKLPSSVVTKMRGLTGIRLPPLRPSVKEALEIGALEEGILASVMKHLSLFEVVEDLSFHEKNQTMEYINLIDILGQTHRRINALIRRLHILADLENQWELEIDCLKEGSVSFDDIFFKDYHLNETRWKELTLLGFLKGLEVDDNRRERAVNDLLIIIEREVIRGESENHLFKTRKVVEGIMEKIELLLKISINKEEPTTSSELMTQSLISWPDSITRKKTFLERERSLDDSILQIPFLKKTHQSNKIEDKKSTETDILNEIFAFIGSHPEKAVSQSSFLDAIHTRQSRNECRNLSITIMRDVLSVAKKFEIGTFVATSLTSIIEKGLQRDEIYFGANSVDKVRENFTELTSILTHIAGQYHSSSGFIIETLCQIPYEKEDEDCLIRNGLVNLLSVLACEKGNSELAWKGFKYLATRCVSWETSNENMNNLDDASHKVSQDEFGLARQLSIVLTNHLVRVTSSYDEKRNESLEEIISLLAFMSKCQTGKDMLSQPSCISDLLELLLEPMSPKMILEIVQLCHIGLPRMTEESVQRVNIPKWKLGGCAGVERITHESHLNEIINLILAKLSDFLVPGSQVSLEFTTKPDIKKQRTNSIVPQGFTNNFIVESTPSSSQIDNSNMSLYVHKRKNQNAHEVIQLLLNVNSEVKLFPMGGNTSNMEKVVKMDKDMTKMNKAEVLSGDASLVFHKGTKLAQHGLVVSIGQKIEGNNDAQACRDKNLILSRTDPVRPFISSYVAHSIATKLVLLFHSLAQSFVWKDALLSVLKTNLKLLQRLVKSTESLYDLDDPKELFELYDVGRKVIATLSIIGAFDWQLKSGDEVKIISTDDSDKIVSIDEDLGIATLSCFGDILLKRLRPSKQLENQGKDLFSKYILDDLVLSFYTLLIPDSEIGIDPLSAALPANGDGWSLKLAVSRVLAEIRTKSCQLLSLYSDDEEFILSFMRKSYQAIDMLKLVSKDVLPTDDNDLIQRKLKNLKSIYRDCFKPPIPSSKAILPSFNKNEIAWNPSINFPPATSTLFSYNNTCLAYHGDPNNHSNGSPKGVFIYGNTKGISYFEINILSLGEIDTHNDDNFILSIGLSPLCQEKNDEEPWTYPTGSIFFLNNGKMMHYFGQNTIQMEYDHVFRQGDIIGVLAEEGKVQCTVNGNLSSQYFTTDPISSLFPAIHIINKGIQVKANFGTVGPFKFDDRNKKLIEIRRDSIRQEEKVKESEPTGIYSFLQFDVSSKNECPGAAGHRRLSNVPSRNALKIKGLSSYDSKESSFFYSSPNTFPIFKSGAFEPRFTNPLDDDSDDENSDDELEQRHVHEDLNSLVVKSWETKIFPIIRRRFRNDSERRDGLEQIKGALSLGMTDIARQTVEFLYEESGGIPHDLHLPTVDDIKEDLSKLSIEGIKKGMLVLVGSISEELGYKIGPESIFETSNQSGIILDVDVENELVQVETYLKLKGVLVRYWYPLIALEKLTQGNKSSSNICPINTGAFDIHNPDIHREVLNMEFALSRIYCRSAYIHLLLYSTQLDLNEIDFESEDESVVSSIMMLQDSDIDNLRLLSESVLSKSDIYGNVLDANISLHQSQALFNLFCGDDLSKLFYSDEVILGWEISRLLEKDGFQSEIMDEVFDCLKNPSNFFITEEIEINDLSILKSCVRFESCAFVFVSCKYEEDSINYEDLVIQIQTLNGSVLKPNGRSMARDIVQYPLDKAFPPLLLAEEMIQVSHGGGGIEKRPSLILHGIHRDFPLAMRTIEILMSQPTARLSSKVGENLTLLLLGFLMKYSAPLILKERIYRLIIKCIKHFQIHSFEEKAIQELYQELRHLHTCESKKFNSYFIALNELLLTLTTQGQCQLEIDPWFSDIQSIVHQLNDWNNLVHKEKILPNDFDRLLIMIGIPRDLSTNEIRSSILKIVDPLGGIYKSSALFVPEPVSEEESRFAVFQVRFGSKINQIKTELESCEDLKCQNESLSVIKLPSDNSVAINALNTYLLFKTSLDNGTPNKKLEKILHNLDNKNVLGIEDSINTIKDSNRIALIKTLMDYGYDLSLDNTFAECGGTYSLEEHASLVEEINEYCKDFSLSPFDIHPNEVYKSRYGLKALQNFNKAVKQSKILSMISLRNQGGQTELLQRLLFTSVKTDFFTSQLIMLRDPSQPPPEISLNPVEDIGTTMEVSAQTWFVQAMNQLQDVDSRQFCVAFATGGDPELPFNVKMMGEEVLGNSGSFRHFLSRSTVELLSRAIPLFVPNLGSERKGLWTLRSDDGISYNTEKYLKFFGQLIGMSLRAGIPLALNLMPQNWKSLAGQNLNENDLKDFDPCTFNLISKIQNIKTEDELEEFLEDNQFPKMSVLDVSGAERELIPEGSSTYLSWTNRNEYIQSLKEFKMREMSCFERWIHVKAGLASIIPMDVFVSLFKSTEIEAIICGPNKVNIRYIREHTIYQVGIRESDPHVKHFWSVLETLSQSQLQKFIKFCSNQDRIQTWSEENLPPYPMKIAPANGSSDEDDDPDKRHIRVETCMFMIKLPRYSSYEVMRKKIIFAISSALDPLSG